MAAWDTQSPGRRARDERLTWTREAASPNNGVVNPLVLILAPGVIFAAAALLALLIMRGRAWKGLLGLVLYALAFPGVGLLLRRACGWFVGATGALSDRGYTPPPGSSEAVRADGATVMTASLLCAVVIHAGLRSPWMTAVAITAAAAAAGPAASDADGGLYRGAVHWLTLMCPAVVVWGVVERRKWKRARRARSAGEVTS